LRNSEIEKETIKTYGINFDIESPFTDWQFIEPKKYNVVSKQQKNPTSAAATPERTEHITEEFL
jgi:hypothetical protein